MVGAWSLSGGCAAGSGLILAGGCDGSPRVVAVAGLSGPGVFRIVSGQGVRAGTLSGGCWESAECGDGGDHGGGPPVTVRDMQNDAAPGTGDRGGDGEQAWAQLLGLPPARF